MAIASLRIRRNDRLIAALWVICAALLAADALLPDTLNVLRIDVMSQASDLNTIAFQPRHLLG